MAMAHIADEGSLFRHYWDDGLVDLLFGLAVLVTGIAWETSLGALSALHVPLWIVLWSPLRRRIVEPHAGFVEFSRARRTRNAHALAWTAALGIGSLALYATAAFVIPRWIDGPVLPLLVAGLPAMLVAVGAVLASVLLSTWRFAAYALALALAAAITVLWSLGPSMPLVAGGLVAAISGATLLTRFIRASRAYEDRA